MSDSKPEETAGKGDPVKKPRDWDKAVAAAYLRMGGDSQKVAADSAGIGERTLREYEKCSWWKDARAEARDKWMNNLEDRARKGLAKGVDSDGTLALRVLERIDPSLAPPKMQAEIGGTGGGPIEVSVTKRIIDPRSDEE